jgi:hypothetical protein
MRASLICSVVVTAWVLGGCTTTLCDPDRYPVVEGDGEVLYVDLERGYSGATGACDDPFGEISDAVQAADSGTTLLVAAGDYGGDIVVEDDVTIVGMGIDSTRIGGVESSVAAQGNARLTLQGVTLEGAWYGIWATASQVFVSDTDVSDNLWFGAYVEQSTASFDRCVFSGHGPGGPGEISGGILASKATLSVADCEFRDNAGIGIASFGSHLSIRRTLITDIGTDALGELGRGVEVVADSESDPPQVYIEDLLVERYTESAVSATGATVDVLGLVISDAQDCETSPAGHGLSLVDSTTTLADVSVTGACSAALSATGSGTITISDSLFTDTAPGADGLGLAAHVHGVDAHFDDCFLGTSVGAGLMASCATSLILNDTSIVGVTPTAADLGGDGLIVADLDLLIDDGHYSDVPRCGIRVVGAGALDITGGIFDAATADLCACDWELTEDWIADFEAANTPTEGGTSVLDAGEWDTCPEPLPADCA